jgi:glycosyltransferase involved in cell wall biosynthesis
MNNRRYKICIVATVPFALQVFMRAHIDRLRCIYDVTLITSGSEGALQGLVGENVDFIHVEFARKIALFSDFRALVRLYRIFRRHKFDVVHSLMPKTGLLAMLAAFLALVPHRVHIFTGQVWSNKSGMGRQVLKMMDRVIAFCATHLLTDSFSQRDYLIRQKIVSPGKLQVLGNGSVCGVDLNRFKFDGRIREAYRKQLSVPEDAIVFMFLGRVNLDKGVLDLAAAFVEVNKKFLNTYLLIVGPDEHGLDNGLQTILETCLSNYRRIGITDRPEEYMSTADVFCLPSYREGFGSVIIEAASVGLPAVASNIYGLVDAVENGETGILHEAKNVQQIEDALLLLIADKNLRNTMATKARQRARRLFSQEIVTGEMLKFYEKLITD